MGGSSSEPTLDAAPSRVLPSPSSEPRLPSFSSWLTWLAAATADSLSRYAGLSHHAAIGDWVSAEDGCGAGADDTTAAAADGGDEADEDELADEHPVTARTTATGAAAKAARIQ